MNPVIIIPARLDSKRLPNKALAIIGDKPMILHVLHRAEQSGVGPVVVACGDQEIADVTERAGGQAILTDPTLPSGSDRVFSALQKFDPEGKYDVIVNLQGDLPLIDPKIVDEHIELFRRSVDYDWIGNDLKTIVGLIDPSKILPSMLTASSALSCISICGYVLITRMTSAASIDTCETLQ